MVGLWGLVWAFGDSGAIGFTKETGCDFRVSGVGFQGLGIS